MPTSSSNLGLTIWSAANDPFDFTQLANNFLKLDAQFSSAGATVISTPIQFIQSGTALPSNPGSGQLFYLTANASGFTANTIVQFRNTTWTEVGQPELVTVTPASNNYTGRTIVFTANSGSFKTGDIATYNGSTYVKVGGGVSTYANVAAAIADAPTSGKLAVFTASDNTLGAGGPYNAYSLAVYNASSGLFQPIAGVPAGAIEMFGGVSAPIGWLLCNGSTLNTTDYPNLFTAIGYTYGGASTTFNLPDLRGRIPVGLGTNSTVSALGNNDGVSVANRSPKHNHTNGLTLPNHGHNIVDPGHLHQVPMQNTGEQAGISNTGYLPDVGSGPTPTAIATTGISIGNPSSNPAIPGSIGPGGTTVVDAPAYITLNFIIKV